MLRLCVGLPGHCSCLSQTLTVWALTQRATRSRHRDHLMNPGSFLEGEAAKTRDRKQNIERYVNAAEF